MAYTIVIEDEFGVYRDQLIGEMVNQGVETRPFFKPIYTMNFYRSYRHVKMIATIELEMKGINLPSSIGLMEEEMEYIVSQLTLSR